MRTKQRIQIFLIGVALAGSLSLATAQNASASSGSNTSNQPATEVKETTPWWENPIPETSPPPTRCENLAPGKRGC